MKVRIKERTGADLFFYLDLVEESKDRANEWAVTEFVEFDGKPVTLPDVLALSGERQAILYGRVFSLNVKGVKQTDDYVIYGDVKIERKPITHDILASLQLKMQRLKERGETSSTDLIKTSIKHFYKIDVSELEKIDYKISAFMFNYINSFLTRSSECENEFDFDDE
jgi:fumarylacetoacetate (FAA) hydrolase family protein